MALGSNSCAIAAGRCALRATLLAEGALGLRAAVVELGRLADDDAPGAQDANALQVGALGVDRYFVRPRAHAESVLVADMDPKPRMRMRLRLGPGRLR